MYCFKNTNQIVRLSVDLIVILLKEKAFPSVVVADFSPVLPQEVKKG